MSEIDGNDRPLRRAARFQISENTLFNAGMDRPTVEALRHLLNAVGNTSDGPTLPDVAIDLQALSLAPPAAEPLPFPDDLTPIQQIAQTLEFIQTEVRQNAEAIAALQSTINDLKQGIYP